MAQEADVPSMRELSVAWATSVGVAFIAGCVYSTAGERGYRREYLAAIFRGEPDAWSVMLYVGVVTAIAAAGVSCLAIAAFVYPLWGIARRNRLSSLPAYLTIGVVASAATMVITAIAQHLFAPLLEMDYRFALIAMPLTGCIASLAMWLSSRPDRAR